MKIGTIRCKLFGHIFVGVLESKQYNKLRSTKIALKNCRRCGIPLKYLTKKGKR